MSYDAYAVNLGRLPPFFSESARLISWSGRDKAKSPTPVLLGSPRRLAGRPHDSGPTLGVAYHSKNSALPTRTLNFPSEKPPLCDSARECPLLFTYPHGPRNNKRVVRRRGADTGSAGSRLVSILPGVAHRWQFILRQPFNCELSPLLQFVRFSAGYGSAEVPIRRKLYCFE
jgi:hypothetical protein